MRENPSCKEENSCNKAICVNHGKIIREIFKAKQRENYKRNKQRKKTVASKSTFARKLSV